MMLADLIAYGMLASIFVVNGLRMVIEKRTKVAYRSIRLLRGFRGAKNPRNATVQS